MTVGQGNGGWRWLERRPADPRYGFPHSPPPLASGFLASPLAGLSTSLGALPLLLPLDPSERTQGVLLGIGGGMLLATTSLMFLDIALG